MHHAACRTQVRSLVIKKHLSGRQHPLTCSACSPSASPPAGTRSSMTHGACSSGAPPAPRQQAHRQAQAPAPAPSCPSCPATWRYSSATEDGEGPRLHHEWRVRRYSRVEGKVQGRLACRQSGAISCKGADGRQPSVPCTLDTNCRSGRGGPP
jgi:hypothetical protein